MLFFIPDMMLFFLYSIFPHLYIFTLLSFEYEGVPCVRMMASCPCFACSSARQGSDVAVPPMSGGYVEQICRMFIFNFCASNFKCVWR